MKSNKPRRRRKPRIDPMADPSDNSFNGAVAKEAHDLAILPDSAADNAVMIAENDQADEFVDADDEFADAAEFADVIKFDEFQINSPEHAEDDDDAVNPDHDQDSNDNLHEVGTDDEELAEPESDSDSDDDEFDEDLEDVFGEGNEFEYLGSADPRFEVACQMGRRVKRRITYSCNGETFVDEINPCDETARVKFIDKLASRFDLDLDEAKTREYCDQIVNEADAVQQRSNAKKDARDVSERALDDTPDEIIHEALEILKSPNLLNQVNSDLELVGIAGEEQLRTSVYIIGTSRKNKKPLAGIVMAPSASGKSHTIENVLRFFPDEAFYLATDITAQALYYLESDALKHRFVVTGERRHSKDREGEANATLALRELLSAGKISKLVPIKGDHGWQTVRIELEGPIAFIQSTTQSEIFDEDRTRMLTLKTNDGKAQTHKVMRLHALRAAGKSVDQCEIDHLIAIHQTMQRLLESYDVIIPFAEYLIMSADKVLSRRLFPQLLSCVAAITLLYQFQREKQGKDLIADLIDYDEAYKIMLPAVRQICSPISDGARRLYVLLSNDLRLPGSEFDRLKCTTLSGVSVTSVKNYLAELIEIGLVDAMVDKRQGKKCLYKMRRAIDLSSVSVHGLISPTDLRNRIESGKGPPRRPRRKPGMPCTDLT